MDHQNKQRRKYMDKVAIEAMARTIENGRLYDDQNAKQLAENSYKIAQAMARARVAIFGEVWE